MLNAPNASASKKDAWETLVDRIRAQAELPAPEPYLAGEGDPLERLMRRMRGEEIGEPADLSKGGAAESTSAGKRSAPRPAPAAGVEAQLGREVLVMLRSIDLPGQARGAAAEMLSEQLHRLEASSNDTPSSAEVAAGLRQVLRILVTAQSQ